MSDGDLGAVEAELDDVAVAELWARSGAQWLTDPRLPVPGRLVRRTLGLIGELDRRGTGLGDLAQADGLGLLAERAAWMGLPPASGVSAGGASRLLRGADGWMVLTLARSDDEELVPAWLEADVPCDSSLWTVIDRLVRERDVGGLVDRAVLLGLPCAAVDEVGLGTPVLATQGGGAPPRPIDGCVVVNLAALWAGPLAADVLARLGARIISVESTQRPDGGRIAAGFFAAMHGRCESVALDLTHSTGRQYLRRLLASADVVIEGSRPRALEQMGIVADEVLADGASVWLSITGHGREPGQRDRVGFGDDAAAAGGLVGWAAGSPTFVGDAIADPLTGLTVAHAAVEMCERGGGWLADVALARVARSMVGGWVPRVADSERPRRRRDPGAHLPLGRDTRSVLREFGVA